MIISRCFAAKHALAAGPITGNCNQIISSKMAAGLGRRDHNRCVGEDSPAVHFDGNYVKQCNSFLHITFICLKTLASLKTSNVITSILLEFDLNFLVLVFSFKIEMNKISI